jgi:hypothetical protein
MAREHREAVARYFNYINEPMKYTNPATEEPYREVGQRLERSQVVNKFKEIYKRLQDIRNDINHAGFTKQNIRPEKFENTLKEIYQNVIMIFNQNKEITEEWLLSIVKELSRKGS